MKKTLKVLALCMAAILALGMMVSCSAPAAKTSAPAETSAAAPAETTAATPAEAEGEAVAAIKEKGKIVMLTNAAFPPFEYLGDDNETAGVDVDICQAIADELGVELEVVDMDFKGIPAAIAAGKGHIAAAGMTVNDERKQTIDFTDTYILASQYMLVPVGSDIKTAADLEGKVIGVQEGTTGDFYTDDVNAKSVERYSTPIEAATALMSGKLDAVITDEMPAKAIAEQNSDKLQVVDEKLTEEEYALGIAKESDLLEVANKVIAQLKADGKIDEFVLNHNMK